MRSGQAIAGGAAAAWLAPGLAPHVPAIACLIGVHRRFAGAGVALTFDDGPHPQGTPAVLEELSRRRAVATFFLVGEQVECRPALAAEIAAAGHTIALHGHRHRNLMCVGPRALADDLRRALDAIGSATGRKPTLYRPPYGIFTPAALVLARRAGWTPLLWSRWGRDWSARRSPVEIAADLTGDVGAGDVLLLHDADFYSDHGSWRNTVLALPGILDELERRGLATTTGGF
ncbi:MAG: polysaccharide deacetylase family protein [Thermoleophilaceae bacterium]